MALCTGKSMNKKAQVRNVQRALSEHDKSNSYSIMPGTTYPEWTATVLPNAAPYES